MSRQVAIKAFCTAGVVVWIFLLAMVASARAHSWYPMECCSGQDCDAISPDRVKELPSGGYLIDNRMPVHPAQVRTSPDSDFHACIPKLAKQVRCFWAPPRGM